MTGSSGAFELRTNRSHEREPRSLFDSRTAVRKLRPSIPMATTRTTTGTHHQRDSNGSKSASPRVSCHVCHDS